MISRTMKRNNRSTEDEPRTSKLADEESKVSRAGVRRFTAAFSTQRSEAAALTNGWDSNMLNFALAADAENTMRVRAHSISGQLP